MEGFDPDKAKKLAQLLIKEWSSKPDFKDIWEERGEGVDVGEITSVLKFLVDAKKLTTIEGAVEFVPTAIEAIKGLQKSLGLKPSLQDGIFGRLTRNALARRLRACPDNKEPAADLPEDAKDAIAKETASDPIVPVLYYIDDSLIRKVVEGESAVVLLRRAWSIWKNHANIRFRQVEEKAEANVIVRLAPIDTKGHTLGIAHVGGRARLASMQLTLTLDDEEDWSIAQFTAAACHEMGHILGLKHSDREDQLMSAYINIEGGIREPQTQDIERMIREWGPAPKFDKIVKPNKHAEDIIDLLQ